MKTISNFAKLLKENKKIRIVFILICGLILLLIIIFAVLFTKTTINTTEKEVFIYPADDFKQVQKQLIDKNIVPKSSSMFALQSRMFSYTKHIKPGRYVIKPHSSIFTMIRRLRSGNQTPVKLVINSGRTIEDFLPRVTKHLMMTDDDLLNEINKRYPQYPTQIYKDIIPDTYEVFWTISAEKLLDKLKSEADKFWKTNDRLLKQSGYNRLEIVTLASIVNEETNKDDEKSKIAGVYVNRLKASMPLQADPTVKFAVGDFSIKRITHEHLQTPSPFNTYLQTGLPPAPICLPAKQTLEQTLKYERHSYIYFCAKEDFSGYHNFATNSRDHINNANRYRRVLNERGIK